MIKTAATMELARKKHGIGDLVGATQLYRQVLQVEPANPEALALLGLACHQAGDPASAEGYIRQALAVRPGEAVLHFHQGDVLLALGRVGEAAEQFRQATRLRPDFVEAWNNLGNILFQQGQVAEAIRCYEEGVRFRPEAADTCYNLGKALREDDRLEEGLKWYEQALRLEPTSARWQNSLGVALLELGRVAEAEKHFREALRYEPGSTQVLWNLASYGLYREGDPGPDRLRKRLEDPRHKPMEVCQLHFILAHLLDRDGAFDEAFHHFREGNTRRKSLFEMAGAGFDAARHARWIDRLLEVFTPAFFERVRGWGLDTEIPVLVLGMPRSGTSLVEQILAHHPEVAGAGELRDIPRLSRSLPARVGGGTEYPEWAARLDPAATRELAQVYMNRLTRLGGDARRVTDKLPENFLHLGLIATLFPRARVVHCRRDPLDTCLSCYFRMSQGMAYACDLEDLGHYFRGYERLMAHWRSVLPLPILDVDYEQLVADLEGQSRRLVAFCGLDWDARCLRFHESTRAVRTPSKLQVRQPVYQGSVGRWRHYAAHLGPLRAALGLPG